jgi:S-adenosylmethionine:tRNA ribosyltransferase-isomerase
MERHIDINDFNYPLPDERIAKFPLAERSSSKLLIYDNGNISESHFRNVAEYLQEGAMLVFNNTRVVRARIVMHKASGARIEVFCLEPHNPADYERAFAIKGESEWSCIVGNLKKWKEGEIGIDFEYDGEPHTLRAEIVERGTREHIVRFRWSADCSFGQLLETLGRIPIPPYLNRESEDIDNTRYQTVYARFEGSVAAPTAGLHFTESVLERIRAKGIETGTVCLHVGAGTFLPVKADRVAEHTMHREPFVITRDFLRRLAASLGKVIAVGTTSVRTLESLYYIGVSCIESGAPEDVNQWAPYSRTYPYSVSEALQALLSYMDAKDLDSLQIGTSIIIVPGYEFRIVDVLVTNFHQPQSTLLLLISAFVKGDWKRIYDYALKHDFRFLSYGDSSLLFRR